MNPTLYHAHHSRYTEDIPFWLALAEAQTGPILELGCGTGRVMLPLLEAGYSVVGLDNDGEMLDYLKTSLPDALARQARLNEADITNFQIEQGFDLVLLPCNTFSTLDSAQRSAALECICKNLKPSGRFALSLPNPHALASLPTEGAEEIEDTFSLVEPPASVQVSSAWQRDENEVTLFWHYDLLQPDGNVERHTASVRQHIIEPDALEAEFVQAGYKVDARYGDFERSGFDEDAPNLLYVLAMK